MRKTSLTVMACAMLLCAGTAQAVDDVGIASKGCEQAKLIAQGELEYCLAQNIALGLEGAPDESAVCQAVLTPRDWRRQGRQARAATSTTATAR